MFQIGRTPHNQELVECFVGGLVLHHLRSFSMSAVEVREVVLGALKTKLAIDDVTETWRHCVDVVGLAVCPTWDLITTSCDDGNVEYFFEKGTLVGQMVRGVEPGEKLTRALWMPSHYALVPRRERDIVHRDL